MGVTERRAREKEALRQSILDAASELVVEQGHQNLSIRKIAEKIEYAPSTIYLYFEDKYEILASICIDVFEQLSERLEELRRTERGPLQVLKRGLRCYVDFGLANPSHYMVTFLTPWPDLPADHPAAQMGTDKAAVRAYDYLRRAIERGIEEGLIKPGDANMMAQATWLAVHGLTSGIICMGADPQFPWVSREKLIEGQLDLLIAGLQA
jgi:AcrR family transcriptional regulator